MRSKTALFIISLLGIMAMMLLMPALGFSQSLAIRTDHNSILLGEQFNLEIKLTAPLDAKLSAWPSVPDSVNHLEVVERGKIDSIRQGDRMIYVQQVTMTGFDSGHWVIPPMLATVDGKAVRSASSAVDVMSIKLKGKDYNDIKEIIEVEPPGWDWKRILLVLLGVLLIATLVYYWWKDRKKKPAVAKPVSRSSAYEEAVKALKVLQQEQLMAKGEAKKYYSRLYDIYRVYLGAINGTDMMHDTTDDILLHTKQQLNGSVFSNIAEVLRISDAVKFAKYIPANDEGVRSMEVVRQGIEEMNRQK